jgi:hypothetical protein
VLDEPKTLAELAKDPDQDTAKVAREFLRVYEVQYGGDGAAAAEGKWRTLRAAFLNAGYSMGEAQTRAIQGARGELGIVASTKKQGCFWRIFGKKI